MIWALYLRYRNRVLLPMHCCHQAAMYRPSGHDLLFILRAKGLSVSTCIRIEAYSINRQWSGLPLTSDDGYQQS